jgi:quinoprotein relay system zinc metallohydrolase 2
MKSFWVVSLSLWLGFFTVQCQAKIKEAFTVQKVAPGLYFHLGRHELPNRTNHGAIANIGFVVGQQCVAVLDSGGNREQGRLLKEAIEKITDVPICYVINSHVHPDHIFGNRSFKESGVQFIGHKNLTRALQARATFYTQRSMEQLGINLTLQDIVLPDIAVTDSLTLDLGGRVLRVTAHDSAHTDNDLSVFDENSQALWLSDLLFVEHLPVVDGSLKGWLKELKGLSRLKIKRVVPGHGPVIDNWRVALQRQESYLTMLLREVRAMIKEGKFIEQAIAEVGQNAAGQWALFDVFHKKNITFVFAELEWED